jgi:lactoylglutathione lyase
LTYAEKVVKLKSVSYSINVSQVVVPMSRVQLALNVDNLDTAVAFYSTLFGTEPAKRKPGYAIFAVAEPPLKLVLLENPGHGGTINHLGVEVESSEKVRAEVARFTDAGLFTDEEIGTTCCFATQDKVWVSGPAGERWEVYTVLADSETFSTTPALPAADPTHGCTCQTATADASVSDPEKVASGAGCC